MAATTPKPKELTAEKMIAKLKAIISEIESGKGEIVIAHQNRFTEKGETTYIFTVKNTKQEK